MNACNIRHLPVRNESGAVVGILSDRDVQRSIHSEYPHDSNAKSES